REDRLNLRPHVAAEAFRFYGAENHGHVEDPGGLRESDVVVDDCLAIEIGDAKEHLRLEVDQGDDTIVGRQQAFFAAFGAGLLGHVALLFEVAEGKTEQRTSNQAATLRLANWTDQGKSSSSTSAASVPVSSRSFSSLIAAPS